MWFSRIQRSFFRLPAPLPRGVPWGGYAILRRTRAATCEQTPNVVNTSSYIEVAWVTLIVGILIGTPWSSKFVILDLGHVALDNKED